MDPGPQLQPYFTKGGQGKFFADPKPIDQHRYQRGYTPERMAEVRHHPGISWSAGSSDIAPWGEGGFPDDEAQLHVRHAQETVARSTTPMHEFESTPYGFTKHDYFPLSVQMHQEMDPGKAGTYQHHPHDFDRGEINVSNDVGPVRAGQTLMHELGHYRSEMVDNSGRQASYGRVPSETGREEAFADDNMVSRWRPDPRDVRKGMNEPPRAVYENSDAFHGMGGKKAHGPYVTARTTLSKPQKKEIRQYGFRLHGRASEAFTHEATGEHWSPVGPGRDWHVQGALFNDRRP